MKVDLAALRSCVNHLFPIFFCCPSAKKKNPTDAARLRSESAYGIRDDACQG